MSSHTPGPWNIEIDAGGCFSLVAEQGKSFRNPTICFFYEDVTPEDSVTLGPWLKPCDNSDANAYLIATAPELLAELEKAVERRGFSDEDLIAARQVIAKAKGQVNEN